MVPVRIDDTGQLLEHNEGKTPGAGLLLRLSSPGRFFRILPLVSKDSVGRDHRIVVPFDVPLTLVVHPSFYYVNDASNSPLSRTLSTKIPLLVPSGQRVPPIKFTITGTGR